MPQGFYDDVVARIQMLGFAYWKQAKGSHEKWRNAEGVVLIVPRNLRSRHTANAILKSAGSDEKL